MNRNQRRRILRYVFPPGILLGLAYISWIFSSILCWNEIYHHHSKSTGIGLIVGNVLFIVLICFIWLQMFILGPGKQPHVPLYRLVKDERTDYRAIEPPLYFMSDKNGFPIWCSNCQSIKIDRSHHSSDTNFCVPKLDHYCVWIGSLVGKRNYRLFIQFCFWFLTYFIFIGISCACFTSDIKKMDVNINPNLIVLYIFDLGWILMLTALFGSHIYYIYFNMTSIDDMARKRSRRTKNIHDQYINLYHNGDRYVLLINPDKDYIWNKGFATNWVETMGPNPLFWMIPWGSHIVISPEIDSDQYESIIGGYKEIISDKWLETLKKRIESGDYVTKRES